MSDATDINQLIAELKQSRELLAGLRTADRKTVETILSANDRFQREGLAQLIRSIKSSPAAAAALRDAVSDPAVYALLRHHELIKASKQEQVDAALNQVRPALKQHGGDVELVGIDTSVVTLRFIGQCDGCHSSGITFREGVEKTLLEQCDWITQILLQEKAGDAPADEVQPLRFVSPFAASEVGIHDPASAGAAQ